MRTFLAGFCAPGGPLAKAIGIFLEKQPLPGDHYPPWEFQKSYLFKNLQLGDANISGGFLRSWRSSSKSRWDFTLKNSPLPGDQRPSPLGISKSYLSKNLQLGDANISGGFLPSWGSSSKSRRDFTLKNSPLPGDQRSPLGNFKKLPL